MKSISLEENEEYAEREGDQAQPQSGRWLEKWTTCLLPCSTHWGNQATACTQIVRIRERTTEVRGIGDSPKRRSRRERKDEEDSVWERWFRIFRGGLRGISLLFAVACPFALPSSLFSLHKHFNWGNAPMRKQDFKSIQSQILSCRVLRKRNSLSRSAEGRQKVIVRRGVGIEVEVGLGLINHPHLFHYKQFVGINFCWWVPRYNHLIRPREFYRLFVSILKPSNPSTKYAAFFLQ